MVTINIIRLGEDDSFDYFKEIEVARVPNIGEKVIIKDDKHTAYVYEVIDIYFTEDPDEIDILVINKGTRVDYFFDLESTYFR